MGGRASKSNTDAYSDRLYQQQRGRRKMGNTSRCCCFYIATSVLNILLIVFLVAVGGLNVLSVVLGYKQHWTYNVDRDVKPAYSIRTGWYQFSDNRSNAVHKLSDLSQASYILGWICLVIQSISVILALIFAIRCLCGRTGRGFICLAIPFSLLMIGSLAAYYIVTAVHVWQYSDAKVGHASIPWPDWAWGMAAGASLGWLLAAGTAGALPSRDRYLEAREEREYENSRPQRRRPLSDVENGYVASTQEPVMRQGSTPMAAQALPYYDNEMIIMIISQTTINGVNPDVIVNSAHNQELPEDVEAPKKSQRFVPTWGKGKKKSSGPSAPESTNGSAYRSRADEIAQRYRQRSSNEGLETLNVEYPSDATPSAPPKGAW